MSSTQSYANIAAGNSARARIAPAQTPNTISYVTSRPDTSRHTQMAREERRRFAARDEQHGSGRGLRAMLDRVPPFFIPHYLRDSRHAQRLQREHDLYIAELRKQERTHSSRLSMSSTSTNIYSRSRSPIHMHRGVASNVIERIPFGTDDELDPFPTAWSETDKASGLEVLGNGSEVRFSGAAFKSNDEAASIRANFPIPREIGLFYYETTILSRGTNNLIGIGFGSRESNLTRLPGWEQGTFAWHGDDGDFYSGSPNSGKPFGPSFGSHDVIGCGINFNKGQIFYTKNGAFIGVAFKDLKHSELYPSIGMKKNNEHVKVNFGELPFVFDIESMMEEERRAALALVDAADVSKLHPPDDESALIQNLIGQYLAHEGFIEASRAFQQDLSEQRRLAPSTANQPQSEDTGEDDINTMHRQRIRRAVLDGDIDRALKYTHTYYPSVLQSERNKDVYFNLRCRKFIEMMSRYSDLTAAISMSRESLPPKKHDEEHDTQMELDEQLQRETGDVLVHDDTDMDADVPMTSLKQDELLKAAIEYGQGLRAEFDEDSTPSVQKTLGDIFAIIAYEDPKASPVGHILDKSGRSSIAEELNGAILVSIGKPSSAAIEKLCTQTENLLHEVAHKVGGPAVFLNARQDFLLI